MNEILRPPSLPLTTQAAEGLPRRRWTVAEIEEMVRAGIIDEDERFELIGGEVVPMAAKGARHEQVKIALNRFFQRAAPERLEIAPETTLRLDKDSFVEPDFCVFRRGLDLRLLDGEAVLLAVEVADTSLAYDLGRKIGIYAAYGVPEVWVIKRDDARHPCAQGAGANRLFRDDRPDLHAASHPRARSRARGAPRGFGP